MMLVRNDDGLVVAEQVEIAAGAWKRLVGLLGRRELPTGHALLLKPCSSIHTCGMKFSIDALYCAKDGRIVKCVKNLSPWRFGPVGAHMVVELPAGSIDRLDLRVGQGVRVMGRGGECMHRLGKLIKDESGQSTVEYGVIASLIVIGLVVSIKGLRDKVIQVFDAIKDALITTTT